MGARFGFSPITGELSEYIDPADYLDAPERSLVWMWRDLDVDGQIELQEAAAEILSRHRKLRIVEDAERHHDDREE